MPGVFLNIFGMVSVKANVPIRISEPTVIESLWLNPCSKYVVCINSFIPYNESFGVGTTIFPF